MAIQKPTLQFRWRKATDEEISEHKYPLSLMVNAFDYFILEQQHRKESIDGVEFVWKAIEIAENETIDGNS